MSHHPNHSNHLGGISEVMDANPKANHVGSSLCEDQTGRSPQIYPAKSAAQPASATDSVSRDRQRTVDRYVQAGVLLQKAIEKRQNRWRSIDFPRLKSEPEGFDDMQLLDQINTILDAQRNGITNKTAWDQCKRAIQYIFTSTSPFATTLLTIAHNGSSVLCSKQYILTRSSSALTGSFVAGSFC